MVYVYIFEPTEFIELFPSLDSSLAPMWAADEQSFVQDEWDAFKGGTCSISHCIVSAPI